MGTAASSSATSTPASPVKVKGKATVVGKKHAHPSFFNHVIIPLAFAPVMFAALLFIAREVGPKLFESTTERPAFLVLPYFGGSLGPVTLGWTIYLFRKRALSFLPGFLRKFILILPALLLFIHNFFTVLYGNINNDAYSDSLIIDVIAPPSAFKSFEYLPTEFSPAKDPTTWAHEDLIDGPHLDIKTVHDTKCGDRSFARFMYHTILPESRVVHLLEGNHIMFGGVWLMVDGKTR